MSFVSILRKIGLVAGTAAPVLLAGVNPALGRLAEAVFSAVILTEARMGPGKGELKRDAALDAVQVALPLIIQSIEAASGRQVADMEALQRGTEKLNDAAVEIMNAFRILPKQE